MDITIREATLDDVIGIVYVQATAWIADYPNKANGISDADVRSTDFHHKVRDWQHIVRSQSYGIWVAASGSEIVGFVAARSEHAQDQNEIYELNVLPQLRSQRIGQPLLRKALGWLGQSKPIVVRVVSYHQFALDFYTQNGFELSTAGEIDFIALATGKNIPTIEMRLNVAGAAPSPITAQHEAYAAPVQAQASSRSPLRYVKRQQLAKLSKLRPSTVKYYTEIGLLPFEQGEDGLARRYNLEIALERLGQIKKLRRQGLSIKQITQQLQ